MIIVQTDAAMLLELTQAYQDFHPSQPPVSAVDPPPGDVCLGESRYDVLAGNHGVCHVLG